jgi:hypothetical protein
MEVSAQTSTQQALTGLQSDISALGQPAPEETAKQQGGGSNAAAEAGFGPSVVVSLSAQAVQALDEAENSSEDDGGDGGDAGTGLTDAQSFSALVNNLAQGLNQSTGQTSVDINAEDEAAASLNGGVDLTSSTNDNEEDGNGVKVPSVNEDDGEGDNTVVSAQVENPEGQGSTGANILAAANNQEQSGSQDVRDLFENNDDQKELS